MDQTIRTIMGVIIRLIAVALFITGLIFAREFLHEKFDPERYPSPQTYPRAGLLEQPYHFFVAQPLNTYFPILH